MKFLVEKGAQKQNEDLVRGALTNLACAQAGRTQERRSYIPTQGGNKSRLA
ncbi:MAG: hypothetical protein O7G31_02745 [Calditrichaeota bacterium]|nr:hypothetical protein [Calditrichota bacterium]